ncbi:tetratricopeptide repeat protein [Hymenobacter lutimineralis]|uniref:Tetratricopeptide repeat protein n=1 Tax=Hymenobacter lutimineralis TaxID=2606448 RepID=A0A5D6UXX2_9BACT|nr:tetratricopeptide repeat protein [Hymenobacter lutimineralis]TYZ08376.1 tetratricopeptide repeat protein [Hymenobacter lutimineralis]
MKLLLLFLLLPSLTLAQARRQPTPAQLSRPAGTINEQPRFGGQPKTAAQLASDAEFIQDAVRRSNRSARETALLYVRFGWSYLKADNPITAIKRFNQAWLLDSTLADVYYGFSAFLQHQQRKAEADQYLRMGQRHDVDNESLVRYYSNLAYGHAQRREYAEAIATNEKILVLDANNAYAYAWSGRWYMQQDTAKARAYLTRAVQLDPQDTTSFLNRGWLAFGQKRYPAAIADYSEAIRLNPRYISAYANRALAYTEQQNYAAAIADWQSCLQLVPPRDKAPLFGTIGELQLKMNDKPGACENLRLALQWGLEPPTEKQVRKLVKENCR